MLKPLLFISLIVICGIAALFALKPMAQESKPAPAASQAKPVKPAEQAQAQARAKEIYHVDCAMCHGDTGNGKTDLAKDMDLKMDDWSDPNALTGKQDDDLFNIIRNGKGKMPPEDAGRAKDDEVWNLITYIRNLPKQQPAAAPSASN